MKQGVYGLPGDQVLIHAKHDNMNSNQKFMYSSIYVYILFTGQRYINLREDRQMFHYEISMIWVWDRDHRVDGKNIIRMMSPNMNFSGPYPC